MNPEVGLLESLWRYKWITVTIVVAVIGLTALVGYIAQPGIQARTTIALATPPAESVFAAGVLGDASLQRYTAQRASFVLSDSVV